MINLLLFDLHQIKRTLFGIFIELVKISLSVSSKPVIVSDHQASWLKPVNQKSLDILARTHLAEFKGKGHDDDVVHAILPEVSKLFLGCCEEFQGIVRG